MSQQWLIEANPDVCPEWWMHPEAVGFKPYVGTLVETSTANDFRKIARSLPGWPPKGQKTPLTFRRVVGDTTTDGERWPVTMWVTAAEKRRIQAKAKKLGVSVPTLLKNCALGQ